MSWDHHFVHFDRLNNTALINYSKSYLKRPLRNRQNKGLNGKWQLNEGRKYCSSPWSILQYVWPALSDNRSLKPITGLLFEWLLKTGFTECKLYNCESTRYRQTGGS